MSVTVTVTVTVTVLFPERSYFTLTAGGSVVMSLSLTTAASGVALVLTQAVSAVQPHVLKATSLDHMYQSHQQAGGTKTLDNYLASFQNRFDDLSTSSRSPRSPLDSFQVIYQAAKEDDAKKAQEKLAALILKQQAKMAAGGRHFDPSLQVICHVVEMLIS